FSSMAGLYDTVFKDLIVDRYDTQQACITAHKFFGKDTVNFVAIDGTEYSKPMFDMVIFYAGAYSCEGNITFSKIEQKGEEGEKIRITYNDKFIGQESDISSCLPLYINEIPQVDYSLDSNSPLNNNRIGSLTDDVIINNSSIAHSLMTFAEIYLAYRFADTKRCNIIFLDGSLSTSYLSLISATSSGRLWKTNCSLLEMDVDGLKIDVNDLRIARHYIINELLELPPARGTYLLYKILFEINSNNTGTWDLNSICKRLNIPDEEIRQRKRIEKYIQRCIQDGIIETQEDGKKLCLRERYYSTWSRIKKLVTSIGDQIFYSQDDSNNPFVIEERNSNGQTKKKWITTLDLAFLSLFSLYMLIEECWKNNVLLLGISKDTAVHEFKNHVMPICINNNLWPNCSLTQDDINNIPNTDRMFLQSLSMFNHNKISVPWALIEYDSAFIMAVPDSNKPTGYVSGTTKNKITPSQLFLRSYIQLQDSKRNGMLRSNVLALDRLVYSNFDIVEKEEVISELLHHYIVDERIRFILFKDKKTKNDLQNLIMNLLKNMSIPSMPDGFGHNKALFIADKVAKWHNQEFSKIVDSTTTLISCDKGLRNFLLYMNTFRENRQSYEGSRRG
ncbi:MAG: hypothetical protein M3247_02615, partial [Thermoproteota archaeon]|nr:hypothetical protein [Thermoproteota archaeon]